MRSIFCPNYQKNHQRPRWVLELVPLFASPCLECKLSEDAALVLVRSRAICSSSSSIRAAWASSCFSCTRESRASSNAYINIRKSVTVLITIFHSKWVTNGVVEKKHGQEKTAFPPYHKHSSCYSPHIPKMQRGKLEAFLEACPCTNSHVPSVLLTLEQALEEAVNLLTKS